MTAEEKRTDEFFIVEQPVRSYFVEKRSKFTGLLFPVQTEEEAQQRLAEVAAEFHNPTHICWALRLRNEPETLERWNDDGEPTHTAGRPILHALQSRELENVLCAVVRYYGGIKLGTGGLKQAYRRAADEAAETAKIRLYVEQAQFTEEFSYSSMGKATYLVEKIGGIVRQVEHKLDGSGVILHMQTRKTDAPILHKQLQETL